MYYKTKFYARSICLESYTRNFTEAMNNIGKMYYLLVFTLLHREKVLEVTLVDSSGQS